MLRERFRDFERNLQKAGNTADTNYRRMQQRSRSATRAMEQDKGVIRLSTDMVAVYGGNLREWSDKIARAIDDPIQGFAALKRAGFQLTDAQLETVEAMRKVGDVAGYQNEMIRILSDSLGGAAGAQNSGMAGSATRAKNAIGAFFEELSPAAKFCGGACGQNFDRFSKGHYPKKLTPIFLDYLFRLQGLTITQEAA